MDAKRRPVVRIGFRTFGPGWVCLLLAGCGGNSASGPATPVITWAAPAPIVYGTSLSATQLDATANVPGTFTYSPSAGTVLPAATHTLAATFSPSAVGSLPLSASVNLSVNQATPALTWPAPAAVTYGVALASAQLDATANVPGSYTYTPPVGTVLAHGAHTLAVAFTPTDSTNYAAASGSVSFNVAQAASVVTWSSAAPIAYGTALSSAQLNASANVPGAFTYTPPRGTVLDGGAHTLVVEFIPQDSTDYASASASIGLTVDQVKPELTWPSLAAISYGTALSASQLDAAANVPGSFTYTPPLGSVLPRGTHTLAVTFTPSNPENYSTASTSASLTVDQATPVLTWPSLAVIPYGTALGAAQLDATANTPGTFTYTPPAGTVLATGPHTLAVTFTPNDTADYTTATATAGLTVGQATSLLTWPAPAPITYGTALSGTQLDATANTPGGFAYRPSPGFMPSAGTQILSVTFTPTDSKDYTTATASVTLTVNQAIPALSWTAPAAITYGAALSASQLDATANVPGSFAYSPALGVVPKAGPLTLSVTFTPTDATDYASASASVPLTVNQAVPVLTWATPAAIPYSTPLSAAQLDATANVPGSFVYNPPQGTLSPIGPNVLAVNFTPTDALDYTGAGASVNLNVTQATPHITWVPKDPIAVGAPLGPSQLDATAAAPGNGATVAGSFVYTPAAGTVFKAGGPQTLDLLFTPTDSVDYASATSSLTMQVSSFGIAAWGDSLTFGDQGDTDRGTYTADLASLILLPVQNLGVPSQSSTEIGVREGGIPVNVTVAGGTIPAAGGVTITFPTGYAPVTAGGPAGGVAGTILGVHGVVKFASGVDTFTRTASGSAVGAPGNPAFVVNTPYASYLPVFWEGRNNAQDGSQILSDLAAQVATVPSGQTYLILSVTNDNYSGEWSGNADYKEIVDLNNQLANTYGSHYLDIRHLLVDNYDSTLVTDVSDFGHDEVPTSLRAILGTTTLASPIGPADTSITLNGSTAFLGTYQILTIDSGANAENVEITAISGDTVTVVRNYGGLNTSHSAGAPVTETDYIHLNAQGYQIVANAVGQFLSAYAN